MAIKRDPSTDIVVSMKVLVLLDIGVLLTVKISYIEMVLPLCEPKGGRKDPQLRHAKMLDPLDPRSWIFLNLGTCNLAWKVNPITHGGGA